MNKNKFLFKFLSVLSCGLLISTTALAASYTDTEGHWADKAIERWTGYKIVEGYGEKLFKPDSNMTRAELAQVVNKLLELKNKKGSSFSDVDTKAWFYDAISACNNAGITNGVGDNNFNPDEPITREAAMVMLGRALDVIPDEEIKLDSFKDSKEVSDWAQGIISSMVSRKIVQGAGDNNLKPKENITRAEILEIINKTISTYIVEDGEYEITEDNEDRIVLSVAKEVTLKGEIKGDIIISQGSEDGEIILDGVKADGEIYISADGATIKLSNKSEVGKVNITGDNDSIVVDKNAKAEKIEVRAENTEIKGDGEVSVVEVMDGAKDTKVETEKTEVKTSENSENTVAGGKDVKPGDSTVTPSSSNPSTPAKKYTVTFDANGGVNGAENEVKVEENNKVTMPENPTREGYIFDGWYLADELYNFENAITQDITLKAMWKFEIKDQASLEAYALGKYADNDITETAEVTENITLNSGIVINRGLEIDFSNHTITMENDISEELDGAKYVICITAKEEVKLSNLIVDAASKARGMQAYMSKVSLDNLTIKNSTGEALLVNGAIVTAKDLNASGNTWGSVNIDKGAKVPEETETSFTLERNGVLEDRIKIWSELASSDMLASEIVKAEGLSAAKIELSSVAMFVWDVEAQLEEVMKEEGYIALIEKDGVKIGYKTLQDAIEKSEEGDTIKLLDDVNLTGESVVISKNITIDGNNKNITASEKTDLSLIKITSNAKIQNVTFNLENSESRAIYVVNDENEEKFVVELLNVTIMNGQLANSGSAIATKGKADLTLDGCIIKDNTTVVDRDGKETVGAIYFGNTEGTLTLARTEVTGNKANGTTGGIWIASTAKLVIREGCTITGNTITDHLDYCDACKEGIDIFLNANSSGLGENKGATATIEAGTIGVIHVEYDKGNYAILTLRAGEVSKIHGNGNDSMLIIEEGATYSDGETELSEGMYKWNAEESKWKNELTIEFDNSKLDNIVESVLGFDATTLQEVTINEDGKAEGNLKFIDESAGSWKDGIWPEDEKTGNYLVLYFEKATKDDYEVTCELNNGKKGAIKLDKDGLFIVRLVTVEETTITVTLKNTKLDIETKYVIDLSALQLDAKEE